MSCDYSTRWPGILWPWGTGGDDSLPYVERCDDCQVYDSDTEAAKALAEQLDLRVMFAVPGFDPQADRSRAVPFVLPHLPELAGDPPDWHVEIDAMMRDRRDQ
jgi:hypothetical protein